jgi:hypothetical protein
VGRGLEQFAWVELPTAGLIASQNCTAGMPGYIDLTTFDWNGVPTPDVAPRGTMGALDTYVSIYFIGTMGGICAGPNAAAVTGANAPVIGTTGTNVPGACAPVAAHDLTGYVARFMVRRNFNTILGYVTVSNGTIVVYRSGPPNEGGVNTTLAGSS